MFGDRKGIPLHIDRVAGRQKPTQEGAFIQDSAREHVARLAGIVRMELDPHRGILEKGEREERLFNIAIKHLSSFAIQYGGNRRDFLMENFHKIIRKSVEPNGSFQLWTGAYTLRMVLMLK